MSEFKYTCPGCHEGFDQTIKNEEGRAVCPHCNARLVYRTGRSRDGNKKGFDRWYELRDRMTGTMAHYDYDKITRLGEIPAIYKRMRDKDEYDDPDYVVYYGEVVRGFLTCPSCGGKTTMNNVMVGSYTALCENWIEPEDGRRKGRRCKTYIEYRFIKNDGSVRVPV